MAGLGRSLIKGGRHGATALDGGPSPRTEWAKIHPAWWDLLPDQGVFATGTGSERTLNTAMRSSDGRLVLVYLSSPTTVFLHLDKVEARTARATWVSPVTGERKGAATYAAGNLAGSTFPGSPTQFFKTPDLWEDAVLLLEASDDAHSKTR